MTEDRFWTAENAYQFDGKDDYIQVAHNSTLNATPTGFTISTWIKANLTQQNDLSVIIEKSHSDYEGWVMQSFNTHIGGVPYSPGFSWGMGHEGTPDSDKTSSISGLELLDTQWHYLTGVFDGTTTKLYIDGILISNKTYAWTPVPNTGNLYIGDWWEGSRNFSGIIDDIRIYNRALSDSEIQQLYTMKPVSGDVDLDAAREEGQQECKTNPASCGITIDSFDGLTQVEMYSAKQTARPEGEQACINNPGSCNITIKSLGGFSQAELDSA
ncbi:conserved hypothetical protein [Beggiatoa sp. SS]|nr:conserved hypothetical protein [Beggiatoa sp. SS]